VILSFFNLLFISFQNLFYNIFQKVKEFIIFFPDLRFFFLDLLIDFIYFFVSPFSLRNAEGNNLPVTYEELTYGEIYYFTARSILRKIDFTSEDVLVDIGSGRGKMVFFASAYFKAGAIGIEILPTFVSKSRQIANILNLPDAQFIQGNFLDFDFSDVTVVYFAGTCISEESLKKLMKALRKAPKGTKIINLSYPLEEDFLQLMAREEMFFSWGTTLVYFYKKIA